MLTPWPISAAAMTSSILPTGGMRMKGLSAVASAASANPIRRGAITKLPPAINADITKLRRDNCPFIAVVRMPISASLGVSGSADSSLFDSRPDARIRAAAADIARHDSIDVIIARLRIFVQQRCRGHDLSRLTVPTLD